MTEPRPQAGAKFFVLMPVEVKPDHWLAEIWDNPSDTTSLSRRLTASLADKSAIVVEINGGWVYETPVGELLTSQEAEKILNWKRGQSL